MGQAKNEQYELCKDGVRQLEYSSIPFDEGIKRRIFIDEETDTELMYLSLKNGLHVQELYRRIIWTFLYHQDMQISDLKLKPTT